MKFSQLFTTESLKDVVDPKDVPLLAKIDPEDIPTEITKELTPNLEEEKVTDPFPEEYIPSTLAGLRETVEAYNYTTALAEDSVNHLQTTLDVVREDSDVSPLSMVSIVAQLKTAADSSIVEDAHMVEGLAKTLTSDNPYRYTATLEALTKTLANMRPVVIRGIRPLISVSRYITQNIDLDLINQELSLSHQRMKPSNVEGGQLVDIDVDKIYVNINKLVRDNISPENMPGIISSKIDEKLEVPITACSNIRNGIEAIKMTKERDLSNPDITEMVDFFKTVSSVQKATLALLETIESHVKVENFNESTLYDAANHCRQATGVFWASVLHVSPEVTPSTKQRKFQVMEDWPVIVLGDDGKSALVDLESNGKHPFIPMATISDMVTFTINDVIPCFKSISENATVIAEKAQAIEKIAIQVMTEQVVLTDEVGMRFRDTFFRVIDATKFSANLSMAAIQSFDEVTEAIIDISKGIGILMEMK